MQKLTASSLITANPYTNYGNLTPIQHSEDNGERIFRNKNPPVSVPHNMTLPEFVLQDAELYADKVAFVEALSGKSYIYRDVVRETGRFGNALRSLGLGKGQIVLVLLPSIAEYDIVALGIMAAGGVFSEITNSAYYDLIKLTISLKEQVKGLELPVIVLGEEHIESSMNWDKLLEAADCTGAGTRFTKEEVLQSDLCALPFSSGTTGISNGVMLTHRNLVANLCSTLFSVGLDMIGNVTTLGLIPFFYIYGITGICCATLRNKGKVVVMNRFDLRTFLNALITQEVKFTSIVPPIILALVKNPIVEEFDLRKLKLRAIMTAAPELLAAFENKFPGVQVQEAYGLTEHSCITLTHGDPIKGDIAYIDDDGDIFIVDRIKELIKYKGFQVAPAELEAILLTHSSDEDAAAVPLPDEEAGEIPAACVVMNPNAKKAKQTSWTM
ncbi:hypothetical protein CRYUN_Cryun04dG0164400 [Craigia yunnanensis]